MNVKTWPHEHTMSEGEDALRGRLQGRAFTLTRVNASWLHVQLHDEEERERPAHIIVGVEDSARTIRFIPSLGPLPLLIFPKTRLLCPPQNTLPVVLSLPLYLRMGIGSGQRFALVSELEPPCMMRALYGPVDAGRLCRSIHSDIAFTQDEAREAYHASQPPHDDEDGTLHLAPKPACLALKIYNAMSEPLEISKIMIPVELLSLYQGADGTPQTTSMKMRLFGQQEAEISSDKIPEHTTPIADMNGTMPSPSRGSWMFSHSYRNKTGLEFGF